LQPGPIGVALAVYIGVDFMDVSPTETIAKAAGAVKLKPILDPQV